MKEEKIVVGEVKIAELRARLKTLLYLKTPRIVYRNSRPVGILISIETSWYGTLEHPTSQKRKARAELNAALAKIDGTTVLE
jgi:hypothetical protein